MIFQFDLPWNFEKFQSHVKSVIDQSQWQDWPGESWYKKIDLVVESQAKNDFFDFEFFESWKMPVAKSRISGVWPTEQIWPANQGWHVDEPLEEQVRIFIPIEGHMGSGIELEHFPPQSTPEGYGYTWDTSKLHRVWCDCSMTMPRFSVIVSLKTGKCKSAGNWAKYFQKIGESR